MFLTLKAQMWLLIMLVGLWKNIYTGCTKCHLDLSQVVDLGSEPNNLSVGLRCEHLFQQKCNEPRRRLVKNLLKETQMLDECKKKFLFAFAKLIFLQEMASYKSSVDRTVVSQPSQPSILQNNSISCKQ